MEYWFISMIKVSVILPVYNEEKYIRGCIESLLNQSYKPMEILIADDGSADKTRQIIKKYPVKYYFRSHQGPAIQCNFLAQKATGKILVRADGDMRHDRNYIINLVKPIFKHETVATFSKEVYTVLPDLGAIENNI